MAEKPSLQTERELIALRRSIGADLDTLVAHAKADADPRRWVVRSPVAVLGTLGSVGALVAGVIAKRGRGKQKKNAPPPPARDQLTNLVLTAAGPILTAFATRAARRYAARLFEDEKGKRS